MYAQPAVYTSPFSLPPSSSRLLAVPVPLRPQSGHARSVARGAVVVHPSLVLDAGLGQEMGLVVVNGVSLGLTPWSSVQSGLGQPIKVRLKVVSD